MQVLQTAAAKRDSAGVVMPLYANAGFLPGRATESRRYEPGE